MCKTMQRSLFGRGVVLIAFLCLLLSEISAKPTKLTEDSSRVNTLEELIHELKNYHEASININYDQNTNASWFLSKNSVTFWLYTRERPDIGLELNDLESLESSDFNEENPTKILVHGWLGDPKSMDSVCTMIKSEYFTFGDYNVICVDWRVLALDLSYFIARLRTKSVGKDVANLITMLVQNTNQTTDDIHIIGHSMGAHIAGYAGKQLGGQLRRITGLDPARPMFPERLPHERLHKNDAEFVDIVHTSSIVLGQHKSIGQIDFFPNGGNTRQPGCGFEYLYGEVCSHLKALEFYALSIRSKDKFKSIKCDSWKDYKYSNCDEQSNFTYLGEYADPIFSGNFYLSVS